MSRVARTPTPPRHARLGGLASLALCTALVTLTTPAQASPSLRVVEPGSAIELFARGNAYEGSFVVENRGDKPLQIRPRPVTTDDDPRLPAGVTAQFDAKGERATLAPGGKQRVLVRWSRGASRTREVYGHVAVEVVDDLGVTSQGERTLVAVHAEVSQGWLAPLFARGLTLLWALPLLGALLVLGARRVRRDDRAGWAIAAAASSAQLATLAALSLAFDAGSGRIDGNDGLQFIERGRIGGGVEYFVGVDGASWPLLALTGIVGLAGALAGRKIELGRRGFFAWYLVAVAGFTLAFVACDLALLVASWGVALGALSRLAAAVPGPHRTAATWRATAVAVIGTALLAASVAAIAARGGPAVLADGLVAPRSFALTSLVRAPLLDGPPLMGLPLVAAAFVLLFAACAPLLPIYPLQTWLAAIVSSAPAPARMLAAALPCALGLSTLVRVGVTLLPQGVLWAQTTLAIVAATSVALAGLSALGERDLRGLVARGCAAQGGLALLGVASATPQGIAGALLLVVTHGLGAALLAGASGALADRVRTAESARLGGLARETPWLSAALVVGLLASCVAPATGAFWGAFLAFTGALPSLPWQAAAAALGLVALGAAHIALGRHALLGDVPAAWRASAYLEPFGGRFPDLAPHERHAIVPLLALALALAAHPRPLVAPIERAALDAAAFLDPPGPSQIACR